ncbi:MAG: hypothetical protein U0871_07830 [Gemmataceae bacterium]
MSRSVVAGLLALYATTALAADSKYDRGTAALERAGHQFDRAVSFREDAASARKSFESAAYSYRDAWASPAIRTPAVAVNQGRAWFLAGHPQMAIRAFHDGLAVYPADSDLQHGLAVARAAVRYPDETDPAQRIRPDPPTGLRHRLSPAHLLLGSAVASLLLTAGLAARLTTRPGWAVPVAAVGLLGIAAAGAAWWLIERETAADRARPVLVLHHEAPLRTGNGTSYPLRLDAPLPSGAEVRRMHTRGGWVQVETAGGAVGWLPETAAMPSNDE